MLGFALSLKNLLIIPFVNIYSRPFFASRFKRWSSSSSQSNLFSSKQFLIDKTRNRVFLKVLIFYFFPQVDYYPYHLAIGDRTHWPKFRDSNSPHAHWLSQSLNAFRNRLLSLLEMVSPSANHHSPLSRANNVGVPNAQVTFLSL